MKKFLIFLLGLLTALSISGCFQDDEGGSSTGVIKISITDAPAAANFEKVEVTFSKLEVSKKSEDTTAEWITINENIGTIDLLTLNNGKLQELGISNLEAGTYNQIRFTVTEATVTVGGVETSVHLASSTVKLTTPFTITGGITTELVVDFDAAHSIQLTNSGLEYTMTPVTRLAQVDLTGAVKGKVYPIDGVIITVIACRDGSTASVAGTVADADGNFLVGYLEPGIYDIYIDAVGYQQDASLADITITAGSVLDKSDPVITLTAAQ